MTIETLTNVILEHAHFDRGRQCNVPTKWIGEVTVTDEFGEEVESRYTIQSEFQAKLLQIVELEGIVISPRAEKQLL